MRYKVYNFYKATSRNQTANISAVTVLFKVV